MHPHFLPRAASTFAPPPTDNLTNNTNNDSTANKKNIKKLDDKYLKKRNIDPHRVKKETLQTGNDLSKYDIDKDSGQLFVYRKGGVGIGEPTGYYIK